MKLLHENLRSDQMVERRCVVTNDGYVVSFDSRGGMEALADEIEKYYIPRPRFDDGEPVHFDDRFYSGYTHAIETVSSMKFTPGGFKLNGGLRYDYGEPVRRCLPEPKVLDADGVEIKVGALYWLTDHGIKRHLSIVMPVTVTGFYPEGAAEVRDANGKYDGVLPSQLTHREPDSLEKLRDDIYEGANSSPAMFVVKSWADRLTAIMERDYERK